MKEVAQDYESGVWGFKSQVIYHLAMPLFRDEASQALGPGTGCKHCLACPVPREEGAVEPSMVTIEVLRPSSCAFESGFLWDMTSASDACLLQSGLQAGLEISGLTSDFPLL